MPLASKDPRDLPGLRVLKAVPVSPVSPGLRARLVFKDQQEIRAHKALRDHQV